VIWPRSFNTPVNAFTGSIAVHADIVDHHGSNVSGQVAATQGTPAARIRQTARSGPKTFLSCPVKTGSTSAEERPTVLCSGTMNAKMRQTATRPSAECHSTNLFY
jgi:hypothetical protein